MAQYPKVQYIRFYTDGTAARKLDYAVPQRQKKAVLPKARVDKRKKIYVDPVAAVGVMVAVCMLIVMAVGMFRLEQAQQETAAMEEYVEYLTDTNRALEAEYAASYDLETVEKTALALGMVPSSQVEQTVIYISVPTPVEEPTTWEQVTTFLTGLFA